MEIKLSGDEKYPRIIYFGPEEDILTFREIPPDWEITSVSPLAGEEGIHQAYTFGLEKYDHSELQIRQVPPEIAGHILNTIGGWIAGSGGRLKVGDRINILGIEHTIAEMDDPEAGGKILRLTWSPPSDPSKVY